jgi:hypothetical protein
MSGGLGSPQGWNRYVYVENDPVNETNSSGLNRDPCTDDEDGLHVPACILRRKNAVRTIEFFIVTVYDGLHYYEPKTVTVSTSSETSALPSCDDLLRTAISTFLASKSSPILKQDSAFVSEVMAAAQMTGVDPRVFAAETAESVWGTSNVAKTSNNPFGLMYNRQNMSFDSVGDAVSEEGRTLNRYVNVYKFNIAQMYSGLPGVTDANGWNWVRPPAYCQGTGCQSLGEVIANALKSMGGDPNSLKYPCGKVGSTECN